MSELPIPWDNIFEGIWGGVKRIVGSVWRHQQGKHAAKAYHTRIFDWYGTTRILGKPDPIKIDRIFTDVLIWEKPQNVRHISAEVLQEDFLRGELHRGLQRLDGLVALEHYPRLFILGKPGSGKTTFLKWIALRCADEYLNGIPIFISLKEMADADRTVWEQMLFAFEACQFPNAEPFITSLLTSGQAVILFDGLDEVSGEQGTQDKVIDDIRDFVRAYPKNRIVVTCRVAAVNYAFEGFKYVEMAEFTPEQIETYIHRYFDPDKSLAYACLAELNKPQQKGLHDMSGSPLLLSLLCLNYEETLTFPARRVDLYEDALKALLVKWDRDRRIKRDTVELYKRLPAGQKSHLYGYLAYKNFAERRYFMPSKMVERQTETYLRTVPGFEDEPIDAEIVLRTMEAQHGILVERARSVHAFAHLTFQEYYTARYIVGNQAIGTFDVLMSHCNDPQWREVFLLTASLLELGDVFFERFLAQLDLHVVVPFTVAKFLNSVMRNTSRYEDLNHLETRLWRAYLTLDRDFNRVRTSERAVTIARVRDRTFEIVVTIARDLDLHLARVLDRDLNRVRDRTFQRPIAGDRALVRDVDRVLARALNLTRAIAHDRDRAFHRDLIRDRDRDLVHDLDLARDRDRTLIRILASMMNRAIRLDLLCLALGKVIWVAENLTLFVELAISTADEMGLASLANAFLELELPQKDDIEGNDPTWISLRRHIIALTQEYWGLQIDWEFTEEEVSLINDYFYGVALFAECLKVSVVSNRKGLKDRLLLAPTNPA